ncbi:MAG: hypothetical protein WCI18_15965 [Pseudomonadota bacterium]
MPIRNLGRTLKILTAVGCLWMGATNHAIAQDAPEDQNYGYTFSTPLACESLSVDNFIVNMQKLAEYCEFINTKQAEKGFARCPTYMCPNTKVPSTGTEAGPTLKVVISTQNNQNGSYYGGYSSMYGGGGGGGGGSNNGNNNKTLLELINISIELTLPLSKRVEMQSCYFPMTPDLVKETMMKINTIAAEAKAKNCV